MSMVLLVEAALFAQSEDRNLRGDPGYAPQRVVVSPLRFPENSTPGRPRSACKTIEQRVRALPGVHSVAFSDDLPMIWHDTVELRPPARPDASQPVDSLHRLAALPRDDGRPAARRPRVRGNRRARRDRLAEPRPRLLAAGRTRSARRSRCPTAPPPSSAWRAMSSRCASAAPRIPPSTASATPTRCATSWRSASTAALPRARRPRRDPRRPIRI